MAKIENTKPYIIENLGHYPIIKNMTHEFPLVIDIEPIIINDDNDTLIPLSGIEPAIINYCNNMEDKTLETFIAHTHQDISTTFITKEIGLKLINQLGIDKDVDEIDFIRNLNIEIARDFSMTVYNFDNIRIADKMLDANHYYKNIHNESTYIEFKKYMNSVISYYFGVLNNSKREIDRWAKSIYNNLAIGVHREYVYNYLDDPDKIIEFDKKRQMYLYNSGISFSYIII